MSNDELWQAALAQVQLNISPANFSTWLKNTKIISQKDGEVIISIPNSFAKEWLENKYNKLIFRILRSLDEKVKVVKYVISRQELKISKTKPESLFLPDQLEFSLCSAPVHFH